MPVPDKPSPKRKVGRPKGAVGQRAEERRMTVREYAMTHVFEIIDMWAEIAKNPNEPAAARVAAGEKVMNRAIGQAAQAQPTESDGPDQTLQRIERVVIDVPVGVVAKKVSGAKEKA